MRVHPFLVALVLGLFLAPFATTASARSSSNRGNNNRPGERQGIINKDTRKEREKSKREEEKKAAEERRAQEKAKKEEAKKAALEKKKQEAEKRKADLAAAKKAAEEKRKARTAKTTEKKGGEKKGDAKGGEKDSEAKEAEAEKMLAAAEEAFAGGKVSEVLKGVEVLRAIAADYGSTAAAPAAAERLEQLLTHPGIGPVVFLAEADQYFGAARYRQAMNKYNELLANFPASEQAAEAAQKIAEIRDGDLLSKTVYTDEEIEDARLWYLSGTIHLENGREAEAHSAWRRVIENYPGCTYAQRAEDRLKGNPQT